MKIAYINTFYAPDEIGGAEKSVRFLAESVVSNGHQATVITLGRQRESSELNGVRIERLPIANSYFPLDAGQQSSIPKLLWHLRDSYNSRAGSQIGDLINQIRPNIVHTNNLSGFSVATWNAIKSHQIRVIHTLRDYYLLCPNTAMFSHGKQCESRCGKCKLMGIPRAHATKHVDLVIGNSQFILDKHLQYGLFRESGHGVIYNAYAPRSTDSNRPQNYIHVGYIGRLAPTKGVEVLIDAIKLLTEKRLTGILVTIAGDGEATYVNQLKQRASVLPIKFAGKVKPEDFYNQVHWVVVPSIWDEPLARVLFEAFSHGVPVIGSSTGGTPELITDPKLGLMYDNPGSAWSLAEKISEAIGIDKDSLWTTMSKACQAESQKFTPNKVYQNYFSAYQSIIQSNLR